jgi:hypothetical protein
MLLSTMDSAFPSPAQVYLPSSIQPVSTRMNIWGMIMEQIVPGERLSQVIQSGTYWLRSHTAVTWAAVEPVQGERNWNALKSLDEELRITSKSGMQAILSVRVTPVWAQQLEGYTCGPIKADKLSAFANFVHDLVTRYSVAPYNVKYWEIWNEADIDPSLVPPDSPFGCWGDQSEETYGGGYYAEMLKMVYPQIKAADPQAQVLLGGLALDCDPRPGAGCDLLGKSNRPSRFLEGILNNGGGAYFDGVSFHTYDYYYGKLGRYGDPGWQSAWNTTGPLLVAKTQFIKELLNQYGVPDKFLLDTELAVLCDSCSNDPVYETTKANYLVQAYVAAIAQGLGANLWYNLFGWRNSGLINPDLSPRPAYVSFQFSRTELIDVVFVQEITEFTGVKVYEFNCGDRRIWVLWSLDGDPSVISLSSPPLVAWDVLGNSIVPAISMNVDLNPLYLEWDR